MAEREMLCRSTNREITRNGEIVWYCTRPMGHEGNHVCEPDERYPGYPARVWSTGVESPMVRHADDVVLVAKGIIP